MRRRYRPRVGTLLRRLLPALLYLLMPVAYATTQCPPEAGHKPEWIGWLGIVLLGAGFIGGPCLAWWLFTRSRGARLHWRLLCALVGLMLMACLWMAAAAMAGYLIMLC